MIYLVDTNVILRLLDAGHPHHAPARAAVEELRQDHQLRATGQNFIEYWNVATRLTRHLPTMAAAGGRLRSLGRQDA